MSSRFTLLAGALLALAACKTPAAALQNCPEPLLPMHSFTLDSKVLGETRRINIYLPSGYEIETSARFPVLYMPDGGVAEDFIHVVDAVMAGAMWGLLEPVIVVGIENTVRRRDLTGPTEVEAEKKAAPLAGGSGKFRDFLREELLPHIQEKYRTTGKRAIVGESLAGLFVVETLLVEPKLFDTYIAISPSVQWNKGAVLRDLDAQLAALAGQNKRVYLTSADEEEIVAGAAILAEKLKSLAGVTLYYHPMPDQFHDTIYRAASPRAFRLLFAAPAPAK